MEEELSRLEQYGIIEPADVPMPADVVCLLELNWTDKDACVPRFISSDRTSVDKRNCPFRVFFSCLMWDYSCTPKYAESLT